MATKTNNEEEKVVVGIDDAKNPVAAEEDFVKGLLEAAAYKENKNDDELKEIEIIRGGKKLFGFNVRPISSDEFYEARKKGAKFVKNPAGKRLPLIESEKDFDTAKFHSWLIYTATIDKDKEKVWNNSAIKNKYNLMQPVESVPVLLKMGEMNKAVDIIMDISGIGSDYEDEDTVEDIVKN